MDNIIGAYKQKMVILIGSMPLIITLQCFVTYVNSEAFSATANLVQLVKSEKEIINSLEAYIADEESRLEEIKR